jgi:hypothetical protein
MLPDIAVSMDGYFAGHDKEAIQDATAYQMSIDCSCAPRICFFM